MRQPLRFFKLTRANLVMPAQAGIFFLSLISAVHAAPRDDILTLSTAQLPSVGYKNLPYANPAAPKGGSFTTAYPLSGDFDNLNPFILRGTAPDSMLMVWQPLFKASDTDSVTSYAELARSCDVSPDGLTVTFHLDPRAKFSDGVKVTAQDVIWTYHTLITQGSPLYAQLYSGVANVSAPDDETVVFKLMPSVGPDVKLNLAGIYVLPEHFWQGRHFADPLLVPPVGSGPYQVKAVSYGNFITYAHVKNWWAENLPSDQGFYNFDTYTEDFFKNDSVALQAFKAGQSDARLENSANAWAKSYDFAAVRDGEVKLERAPMSLPVGIYGLVQNSRRPDLQDQRVRQALTIAFDFEWMNRVLFHGSYLREHSYFTSSPMASSGLPSLAELKLLTPFKDQIPAAVFTAPYTLPVTDGSGYNLPQLEQAMQLLNAAGWQIKNFKLVNAAGEPMNLEILLSDQRFERIVIAYAADLKLLGINAIVHTIDDSTFQRRMNDFDFDITMNIYPATDFPGSEQADYWGCDSAKSPGGSNWAGICSPAIEAMIKAEMLAQTPEDKQTAIHALDRLLLNGWYIIPWWTADFVRIAYWRQRVAKPAAPLQVGFDYSLWWAK